MRCYTEDFEVYEVVRMKKYLKDNLSIWILCIGFTGFGVFLTQNEIPLDHWFIEASADGLFGLENTSLWVLCSNFVLTSTIYVLSKTGLRLFWFNIIMVILMFVSNVLICKVLAARLSKFKMLFLSVYLIFVTPFLYNTINFTIVAAYAVAAGLIWILHCIKKDAKFVVYIPGYICFLYGFSIRWDCVLFGGSFIIGLVLIELVQHIQSNEVLLFFKRYAVPYALALLIFISVTIIQLESLDNHENGFNQWNTVRTKIDDYDLPEYEQNLTEYEKIGISLNDYSIMKSWNNYDQNIFTKEKYEEILDFKGRDKTQNTSIETSVWVVIYNFLDNAIVWFAFAMGAIACFVEDKKFVLKFLLMNLIYICLLVYFLTIGRLISRIEYSIIVTYGMCFFYIMANSRVMDKAIQKRYNLLNKIAVAFLVFFCFVFQPTNGTGLYNVLGGNSIMQSYKSMLESEDIFGKYIWNKLFDKLSVHKAVTTDYDVAKEVLKNKDNIYLEIFCQTWKQIYPLTDKDIFRTGDVGVASNMGMLGLYMPKLSVLQQVYSQYKVEVDSPYKSITNENVYVVVRSSELYERTNEITNYLKEHYNQDTTFSVQKVVGDAAIGKYLVPMDTKDMKNIDVSKMQINFNVDSGIPNFSKIEIIGDGQIICDDSIWVEVTTKNGETMTFELEKDINGYVSYCYNDVLGCLANNIKDIKIIAKRDGVYEQGNLDSDMVAFQ